MLFCLYKAYVGGNTMLSRILGEDIYRSVNVEYCMKIKKQKEKLRILYENQEAKRKAER